MKLNEMDKSLSIYKPNCTKR